MEVVVFLRYIDRLLQWNKEEWQEIYNHMKDCYLIMGYD
jgi:hypothetical protein